MISISSLHGLNFSYSAIKCNNASLTAPAREKHLSAHLMLNEHAIINDNMGGQCSGVKLGNVWTYLRRDIVSCFSDIVIVIVIVISLVFLVSGASYEASYDTSFASVLFDSPHSE